MDINRFIGAPLVNLANQLRIIDLNIAASVTFLFWDILLTFDREVKYIWKSKFSLITVVFGVVRLFAVALNILYVLLGVGLMRFTDSSCKHILWFQSLAALIMSTGSDILLISRVYAFYGRNKALLISLCILEAIAFVAVLCTLIIVVPRAQVIPAPFPYQLHIGNCISLFFPRFISDIWIPILCVQTVLFGLAAGRHLYLQWKNRLTISRLYYTFMRDGVWCFFVLFVIYLLCIVGIELNNMFGLISFYWCLPVIGACTSRLILNLRSANDLSQDYSTEFVNTSTKMKFAKGPLIKDDADVTNPEGIHEEA